MGNEVAIRNFDQELAYLKTVANMAQASGLYTGVGGEAKIFMIILAAQELGIPPMTALNGGIWNIQGKIEISARLMNSMIRRAGHSINVKTCNAHECVIEGKRMDNGDAFTARFSIEDAAKAGLTGRGPWKSYTEDMLYARAMSRLARRLFPDVIGTAYVEGEIRDGIKIDDLPEVQVEEVKEETEEEKMALITKFSTLHPEMSVEKITEYLQKYASHWKKTIAKTIEDYTDPEKFIKHFTKWAAKEEPAKEGTK